MTETQTKLIRTLEQYNRYVKRKLKEIEQLRKQVIQEGCDHPITQDYDWEWDDGYGKQKGCKGLQCTLCLKKDHYPRNGKMRTSVLRFRK